MTVARHRQVPRDRPAAAASHRPRRRVVAVPRRRRAHRHLRRHPRRQLLPRLPVHARRLHRLVHPDPAPARAPLVHRRPAARRPRDRRHRDRHRNAAPAPHLQGPGAVPAAGHLRRRADRAGRHPPHLGRQRPRLAPAPLAPGHHRTQRFPLPRLRPRADRHRAPGVGPALAAVHAHALGHAGAGGDAGPGDGGRTRRGSALAVHQRVRARRGAGRAGRRAGPALRLRQPRHRPGRHHRRVRGRGRRRPGVRCPAPTSRRC